MLSKQCSAKYTVNVQTVHGDIAWPDPMESHEQEKRRGETATAGQSWENAKNTIIRIL